MIIADFGIERRIGAGQRYDAAAARRAFSYAYDLILSWPDPVEAGQPATTNDSDQAEAEAQEHG